MERQTFVVAEKNVEKIPAPPCSVALTVRAHKKPPIHSVERIKEYVYVV